MSLSYPFRLAALELRSGLQGFRIFLACLIIGVAAIAGVGSLSDRLEEGLVREGQPLLGGDVEFSLPHRELTPQEDKFMKDLGQTSEALTLRAMAAAGEQSALVEVKAVDGFYPLYGKLALEGDAELQPILSSGEAVADPLLFTRFGLEPGDRIKLGDAEIRLAAKILREPDKISSGFALGPRLLISRQTLDKAAILKPGSLASLRVRVKLADPDRGPSIEALSKQTFPSEPWRVRARGEAAPQLVRGLEQLTLFLTLAGLTALITGGIGIANAVKAFLDGRRRSIAILKSLGATSGQVLQVYLAEVLIVAAIGISIGAYIGAVVPAIVASLAASVLPIPIATGVAWSAIGVAVLFGFIAVIAFTLWPLGRAVLGEPAILLRGGVGLVYQLPSKTVMAAIGVSFLALGLLAFARFDGRMVTVYYLAGLAAAFVLLAGLGVLVMAVARKCPHSRHVTLRLAVANLHRPGAATPAMMLALGLGLTLFVALAQVEAGLGRELRTALPQAAPSFYFVDVEDAIEPELSGLILATPGVTSLVKAPILRGRITALNGVSPDSIKPTGDGVWALRGDRGITYSDVLPPNSTLVAGQWWQAGYSGPPLVSLTRDVAEGLGLKIGDKISVNILGRDITAEITSLRDVNWRSLGINFVMVFSPNTLAAAPKNWLMTADVPGDQEGPLLKKLTASFPAVTAVRVRDALDAAEQVATAFLRGLRAGSLLTLVTGTLVLMGALSGSLAARSHDAVVLKTCGATRRELVTAFAVEYALVGLIAAGFAVLAGSAAGWLLLTQIFEVPFLFAPGAAAITAALALTVSTLAGLIATWRALSLPPAAILRGV